MRLSLLAIALLVFPLLVVPAFAGIAAAAPQTVSQGRLHDVRIIVPDDTPKALVIYLSDLPGWQKSDDDIVEALRQDGDVVLAVDYSKYAAELNKDDGECLYVVGELTDLAQTVQRQLDIQSYMQPIVVGIGQGATFAYAAIADSPANTLGGAVAAGFQNRLTLKEPFCPGASAKKTADGKAYTYGFDHALPDPASLFVDGGSVDAVTQQAASLANVTVAALDTDDTPTQIVGAVSDLAGHARPFDNLPAVDLPSSAPPKAIAILASGDGGWRDLDKTIGEWLATQGVHVVGLDSLHYFWAKRTPEELARDIASLADDANPEHDLPVMLIGYSFGADTLPFAYPLLPKDLQQRIKVVALMAPGLTTSFQVTVDGWLGIDDSGYDIAQAIAALPTDKVLCISGEDEDESACRDPRLKAFTHIETTGGHHFDGDYEKLAQNFLDRLPKG